MLMQIKDASGEVINRPSCCSAGDASEEEHLFDDSWHSDIDSCQRFYFRDELKILVMLSESIRKTHLIIPDLQHDHSNIASLCPHQEFTLRMTFIHDLQFLSHNGNITVNDSFNPCSQHLKTPQKDIKQSMSLG